MGRPFAGTVWTLFIAGWMLGACKWKDGPRPAPPADPKSCSVAPSDWDREDSKKRKRIRKFFQKRTQRGIFNGTVLFAEDGRILHKGSYGVRERSSSDSLEVEDPFQLASTSKSLTATLILRLWERDSLSLKDSLSQYFDDWPYKRISLRMLLTHRSGLPNYMYFMDDRKAKDTYDNEDVLRKMQNDTPNVYYVPDHRYNYCNTNYCLLALIAERVMDTNFRAAIREEVYQPAGMKIEGRFPKNPHKASVKGHNKWGRTIGSYRNRVLGDKGLWANVEDLYHFDQALRDGDLLKDSTLEEAYTPQHSDLYQHDNYGLGWRVDKSRPDDRVVWHNGWWKGFRTYFIRMLERDATIIVLNNSSRGSFLNNSKLIQLLYPERKPFP